MGVFDSILLLRTVLYLMAEQRCFTPYPLALLCDWVLHTITLYLGMASILVVVYFRVPGPLPFAEASAPDF